MAKWGLWLIGTTITGTIGWYLGAMFGGLLTAWTFSVVGTALGAWYVSRWVRNNLP